MEYWYIIFSTQIYERLYQFIINHGYRFPHIIVFEKKKKKINMKSSTETEIIEVDDAMIFTVWTKLFFE